MGPQKISFVSSTRNKCRSRFQVTMSSKYSEFMFVRCSKLSLLIYSSPKNVNLINVASSCTTMLGEPCILKRTLSFESGKFCKIALLVRQLWKFILNYKIDKFEHEIVNCARNCKNESTSNFNNKSYNHFRISFMVNWEF